MSIRDILLASQFDLCSALVLSLFLQSGEHTVKLLLGGSDEKDAGYATLHPRYGRVFKISCHLGHLGKRYIRGRSRALWLTKIILRRNAIGLSTVSRAFSDSRPPAK